MLYAIVSDIHANAVALKNVLTDAQDLGAERIICLGDILGYGPQPAEALDLVYRNIHVCLAGNHDDAVCGRTDPSDFTEFAQKMVLHHRELLTGEAIAWLEKLPYVFEESIFACTHGDFSDPENFNYILEAEDAIPSWMSTAKQLLFAGHTHESAVFVLDETGTARKIPPMNFKLEPGKRYIVNAGSVGYPRTGACRSSYCLFNDEDLSVSFRQLPFDLEGYRLLMEGRGLDEAPWMLAKENASRRPSLRSPASFAKSAPEVPGKNRPLAIWPFLSIGAVAVVLVLVAALLLLRSKPPAVDNAQIASIPLVPGKQWHQLANGWKYYVENTTEGFSAAVSSLDKEQSLTFHSNSQAEVILTKEIKITGNGKMKFRTLKPKQGSFALEGKILFLDKDGKTLRTELLMASKGKSTRNPKVPAETVSAKTEITLRFKGDLILPPIVFEEN